MYTLFTLHSICTRFWLSLDSYRPFWPFILYSSCRNISSGLCVFLFHFSLPLSPVSKTIAANVFNKTVWQCAYVHFNIISIHFISRWPIYMYIYQMLFRFVSQLLLMHCSLQASNDDKRTSSTLLFRALWFFFHSLSLFHSFILLLVVGTFFLYYLAECIEPKKF